MTQAWTTASWTTTIWIALIATQVDIYFSVFLLLFFSFAHGIIMYQFAKARKDPDFNYMDFLSFIIIAICAWIWFALFGLIAWVWEYYIYLCICTGSISWKRGFEAMFRFITKKITGKEIYLFDKE